MMSTRSTPEVNGTRPVSRWILWGFLAVIAFYLITEHTAHLFGILPYLLLLACPLMHLFMHGRHGGHGDHNGSHSGSHKETEGPSAGGN